MNEWMEVEHLWNDTDGKIKVLWVKPSPVPLSAPQIPHYADWDWTQGIHDERPATDCQSHGREFVEKCVNVNYFTPVLLKI